MTRQKGYTLVEMITVTGIGLVVASLLGSLYLTITRAVEVELARSEMVAGAREVIHYLQRDVRRADSLAVTPASLTVTAQGERITYSPARAGVSRRTGAGLPGPPKGARLLGNQGISVAFSPLGSSGVEVTLTGERAVRSRVITVHREVAIARRKL
jgi:prepilin-type N-terminal cleavage/methylation domain-containing protein